MRDNSTSIAKAFGIILMVIGHAGCPEFLRNFIYQFHIPLFFFFSGYCFKDKYLSDFTTYTKRKFTGIYLPYIKYALLFLLLHNVFFGIDIYNADYGYNGVNSQLYNTGDMLHRALKITTCMSHEERLLGGYWFLKILFCTSFLGYAFYRFLKKGVSKIAGITVISVSAIVLAHSEELSTIWNTVALTLFATIFFVAGKTLADNKQLNGVTSKWWVTLLLLIITCTISQLFPSGFTASEDKIIYIIGALAGILMTQSISTHIQKLPKVSRLLVFIGDNTFPILTWHFLCFVLVSWGLTAIYDLPLKAIASFPVISEYASEGWWLVYSVIGLVIPLGLVWLSKTTISAIAQKKHK